MYLPLQLKLEFIIFCFRFYIFKTRSQSSRLFKFQVLFKPVRISTFHFIILKHFFIAFFFVVSFNFIFQVHHKKELITCNWETAPQVSYNTDPSSSLYSRKEDNIHKCTHKIIKK